MSRVFCPDVDFDAQQLGLHQALLVENDHIHRARRALLAHPLLSGDRLDTLAAVRTFTESHVFAVWDFMSLLKSLQAVIAPATAPWTPLSSDDPANDPLGVRMVNEIVLTEESDLTPIPGLFLSHFELYRRAMAEIGATTAVIDRVVAVTREDGIDCALALPEVPEHCRQFVASTFAVVRSGQPHRIAAAFAFGREDLIPDMFRGVLSNIGIDEEQAPWLHFYLKRHIEVDDGEHGPAALKMVDALCGNDPQRLAEAEQTALEAIAARHRFWHNLHQTLHHQ